jgi:hypothetical protein
MQLFEKEVLMAKSIWGPHIEALTVCWDRIQESRLGQVQGYLALTRQAHKSKTELGPEEWQSLLDVKLLPFTEQDVKYMAVIFKRINLLEASASALPATLRGIYEIAHIKDDDTLRRALADDRIINPRLTTAQCVELAKRLNPKVVAANSEGERGDSGNRSLEEIGKDIARGLGKSEDESDEKRVKTMTRMLRNMGSQGITFANLQQLNKKLRIVTD